METGRSAGPRHPRRQRVVEICADRRQHVGVRGIGAIATFQVQQAQKRRLAFAARKAQRRELEQFVRERSHLGGAAGRRAGRRMLVEPQLVEELVAPRADRGIRELRDRRDDRRPPGGTRRGDPRDGHARFLDGRGQGGIGGR